MQYFTYMVVLICFANLAAAGMFDGLKDMAQGMMSTVMGPSNPIKDHMETMMKMAQGAGGNFMGEMQKQMVEMTQKASQMTGAGGKQAQEMAKNVMEEFEKMKSEGAPVADIQKYMQTIMQQMQNNPLKDHMETMMKMAQGAGGNFMGEMQKQVVEMTQKASQMTGAGGKQAQEMAKNVKEEFEKMKSEGAPAADIQKFMQKMMQQMSSMSG